MPVLLLLFLFLASCSDNLTYNEATPHISIEIVSPHSDTVILAGDSIAFEANIKPSHSGVKTYWSINSRPNPYPGWKTTECFSSTGIYNAKFYAVDKFDDTLSSSNLTINVSTIPVCNRSIGLEFSYGSSIFTWHCDSIYTYRFLLRDKKGSILKDSTLRESSLQFGKALPSDYWEISITATNSFGFKTELDSAWSAP